MNIHLTERDASLLKFIWKWKLVGTSALTEKYFPGRAPVTAYNRLLGLKNDGYIKVEKDDKRNLFAWGLTNKGFKEVRELLQVELKEEGFGSENIYHDFLVSAFHIGDWLRGIPDGSEAFSEQQLRRFYPEHYPSWIPRSFLHRPDGYWLVPLEGAPTTIALEVELSTKKDLRYEILAEKCEAQSEIFRVIWLVPTVTFAHYVQERLVRSVKDKSGIHNFVTVDAYRRHGWQTPFVLGYESGRSIEFLLNHGVVNAPRPVSALSLLDGRLCPYKTNSPAAPRKTKKRYRLALSASPSITPNVSPNRTSSLSCSIPTLPIISSNPSLIPTFNKEVNSYEK